MRTYLYGKCFLESMKSTLTLVISLFWQGVLLLLLPLVKGWLKISLFALFWVATFVTLVMVIRRPRWGSEEWLVFGSFATTMIIAVLFSSGTLMFPQKSVGAVSLLLFVSAYVVSVSLNKQSKKGRSQDPTLQDKISKDRPLRTRSSRKKNVRTVEKLLPEHLFYAIPGTAKYHRRQCRMLRDRDDLEAYPSEELARASGKSRCKLCFP